MKLIEKVTAYKAIREMMKENWDFDFIFRLTRLMRSLEAEYALFCNEEMKLVATYGKKEENGKVALDQEGVFSFDDEEDMRQYQQKHKELEAVEMDTPAKISVHTPKKMRGDWLNAIEPFCIFLTEEQNHE